MPHHIRHPKKQPCVVRAADEAPILEDVIPLGSVTTLFTLMIVMSALCAVLFSRRRTFVDTERQRSFCTAMRSVVLYLLAVSPVLWPGIRDMVYPNLWSSYHWLLFWYCFLVGQRLGIFVSGVSRALLGTFLGLLGAVVMNTLMSGGAALAEDPDVGGRAWLPGGYSWQKASIFTVGYSYLLFLADYSLDTQRYAVSMFAIMAVAFMDPDQDGSAFTAIVFDWDGNVNWSGPCMCSIYPILIAVPFAFLALPVIPCARHSSEHLTCQETAKEQLRLIASDTEKALARLMDYWYKRKKALVFDLEACSYYVQELELRCATVDNELDLAEWEWVGHQHRTGLQELREVSGLLKSLHQALRVQLDQLRWHSIAEGVRYKEAVDMDLQDSSGPDLTKPLNEFMGAIKELLLITVISPAQGRQNGAKRREVGFSLFTEEALQEAEVQIQRADNAVKDALYELVKCSGQDEECFQPTGERDHGEQAFLDGLRSLPALFLRFVNVVPNISPTPLPRPWTLAWQTLCVPFAKAIAHRLAMRYTAGFALAFVWSTYVRGFRSSCVGSVCFMYSASLGTLTERNVNRMLGVALGIYVGNMPDAVLCKQFTGLHGVAFRKFHGWYGLWVYLIAMIAIWVTSMYGALALGSKWSYACWLWGGFASAHLVGRLKMHQPALDASENEYALFMDVMDHFAAAIILFFVDLLAAHVSGTFASSQVEDLVPKSLSVVAKLLETLRISNPESESIIEELDGLVKEARRQHLEVVKEDQVWSTPWKPAYKMHFVASMLDHCERIVVASRAVLPSAERCADPDLAASIIRDVLPPAMTGRTKSYASHASNVLLGKVVHPSEQDEVMTNGNGDFETRAKRSQTLDFGQADSSITSKDRSRSNTYWSNRRRAVSDPDALEEMVRQFDVMRSRAHTRSQASLVRATTVESLGSVSALSQSRATRNQSAQEEAFEAAMVALRIATLELRLTQQHIETLLREQAFWAWHQHQDFVTSQGTASIGVSRLKTCEMCKNGERERLVSDIPEASPIEARGSHGDLVGHFSSL